MENALYYIKKFKIALAILLVAIFGFFGLLFGFIVPQMVAKVGLSKSIKEKTVEIEDLERKIADLKKDEAAKELGRNASGTTKAFYRPIGGGNTETAMAEEISDILEILKNDRVKIRSIKYDYDPMDDNFIKNAPDKFSAARLNLSLVTEYSNFERFLKDVYKHEHFIDIAKIEITPYAKNKKILLIDAQIKLYAQKTGGGMSPGGMTPGATPGNRGAAPPMGAMPSSGNINMNGGTMTKPGQ